MSHALYRLGRFAARRPWVVIGTWLVVSVVVVAASGAFGRELEAEGSVPGLDSQEAVDLLSAAESDTAGLTAQVVMTPLDDGVTFFESADAQAALSEVQAGVATLPHVLGTSDPAGALAAGPEAAATSGSVSPGEPEGVRRRGARGFAAANRDGRRPVLFVRGGFYG